jgi:GT2 family glycosyltransferase
MVSRAQGERPEDVTGAVRPRASVIVPFVGSDAELDALMKNLEALERRPGDEVIVVDNRRTTPAPPRTSPSLTHCRPHAVTLQRAGEIATPAFARNEGSQLASAEWLVFIDADTRPRPDLLDAYFNTPPAPDTAALAGGIIDVAAKPTLVARHDVARGRMGQGMTLRREGLPYAQTANCAVRRVAFEEVAGFDELARAGEDADLCFRLQRAGWKLEERPGATVQHRARQTLRACLAQNLVHGAGVAWLNRQWPGEFPTPGPRWLAVRTLRLTRQALRALTNGDRQEAAFILLDLAEVSARDRGRLLPNTPRRRG